jgi:branched-chain amino acid transport system ATP-binding protein
MQQLVVVNSVEASYGKAQALFDISFEIKEGDVLGIIGPNGAGKTTLLDCLTGFKSFDGTIAFRGDSVRNKKPWSVAGGIGYATEEGNLFDDLSVVQNLKMGSYTSRDAFSQNAQNVYELFPRLEQRKEQTARTLSGGEQQMLAIGRAMMTDPDLLILDEPSLGLAPSVLKDIREGLEEVIESGLTVLLAEQNVTLALELSDQLLILENGRVAERGTPEEFQDNERIQESYFG